MLWSSETRQNSAYKRNNNYGVLYASGHKRKKVQLEIKIVVKLLQGMKNSSWKNEFKVIFFVLYERCENALKAW